MKIQTQLKLTAAAALITGLATISSTAQASTLNVDATVTVNNTIAMTSPQGLDFGEISALADHSAADSQTTIVMPADPAFQPVTVKNTGASAIIVLGTAVQAVVEVTGAAPDYAMTVTLPPGDITLLDATPSNDETFTVNTFTKYATLEGDSVPTAANPKTDGTGALTLSIGASLTTTKVGASGTAVETAVTEGTYASTFPVIINY